MSDTEERNDDVEPAEAEEVTTTELSDEDLDGVAGGDMLSPPRLDRP
jgi:hypothetical protein